MAELSASSWAETDADNNGTVPDGWPENQAPSTVNDCGRSMMGAIKRFWNRINPANASGGSSNAYTLTPTEALAAYVTGEVYSFRANHANTGAATLNISSLGAKDIKKFSAGSKAALAANDIGSGQPVQVVYDGTDMVMLSGGFAGTYATDAQVRAATTGDLVLKPSLIESASAAVALTDAATVAVDWDAGIYFTLTVTANRTIGNPTNGQPGTTRTILVQGNDTTDRTITFGNQYLGDVPTITDCDSARWYLLTIFCATTSHFVVSARVAKT